MVENLRLQAIGYVQNARLVPIDDDWDQIVSSIQLNPEMFTEDSTQGLDAFSHVEVVFYLNQVEDGKIETGSRHPRNNKAWPKVGILAQRGKNRPNKIAVTRCALLKVDGLAIEVRGLDAIHHSPVLDIKPVFREFESRGTIHQPEWATAIMKDYF